MTLTTHQNSKQRILLLSEIFPPQHGGSGRWFYEIYRRFPEGRAVIAAGQYEGAEEFDRHEALTIERLNLSLPQWGLRSVRGVRDYWRLFHELKQIIQRHGITEIHCGRCLPEGWLAFLLHKTLKLPYVCYVHGEDVECAAQSRELRWMTRRVLGNAKQLIANSQFTASRLQDGWQIADDDLTVLNPGVDSTRFRPAAADQVQKRPDGWQNRSVILTIGRLQKRKGHDVMIRGLKTIRDTVPDVLYSIIGDGEERQYLQDLAREHGVENCVQFCGEVDDSTMIASYQQCDLFALPNRRIGGDVEGFGMVLAEAQSCGRPVLAGASGGTRETMIPGETGIVMPCEQPEPLANEVIRLLKDPNVRQDMGSKGRKWITENLDWEPLSHKAMALFGISAPSQTGDTESSNADHHVAEAVAGSAL